jgi:hypothetical protein
MMRRLSVIAALLATPAAADIPTVDGTVLNQRQSRGDSTTEIDKVDRDRYTNNASVTCAVFRPARKDDPVAAANANPSIAGLVRRVAREEGVDENQFLALVYQESRFNPCAKSGAGALGLAQLMPGTAAELGVNPYNIEQNLRGGARYFKQQLDRFGGNLSLALAAYNSGSGNVENYGGIPPFRETQDYVRTITQEWLPAFGGSDKSGIPLNYGGTGVAYEGMRSSTIKALALTSATGDGSGDVASWFEQFGSAPTGTVQDSWDQNSAARNATIDMLNRMVALSASLAELANSRNAVTASEMSGANRSGRYQEGQGQGAQPTDGPCDDTADDVSGGTPKDCARKGDQNDDLLLVPQ